MCPKLCIRLTFIQNIPHKKSTRLIWQFMARFQDPSTRRRPFLTGTAVKNAAKEPTERDGMPVAGSRRTGATGTACSPNVETWTPSCTSWEGGDKDRLPLVDIVSKYLSASTFECERSLINVINRGIEKLFRQTCRDAEKNTTEPSFNTSKVVPKLNWKKTQDGRRRGNGTRGGNIVLLATPRVTLRRRQHQSFFTNLAPGGLGHWHS
ncbi:hypothetical protein B0H16DRAFT_260550 [Mycena metata]|uniref:Uncharacterized protein n=1 Tax=Mycena metata TaxID=1033252 RepID=A0AAD7MQX1_9AGAR|nr:hypothetical protein B0H16DRAFT_260550 [Mycena metata]